MSGRKFSSGNAYRYGFNGQERSFEMNENSYTAEFWEYDSRIGRRWNVDPVLLVSESPYLVNGGNPILYLDPLGDFKSEFRAKWHRFWNGGGAIRKNQYNEWYVVKDKGIEVKQNGEVIAKSEYYYGKGRNAYSTLADEFEAEIDRGDRIEEMTRQGIWDPNITPEQGAKNAANLGFSLILPSPWLKTGATATTVNASTETVTTVNAVTQTNALVKTGIEIGKHALQRMTERGITKKMVEKAISLGAKYYDPKNGTFAYVLKNGFASGKDLLVATNTVTGKVTTVIRGANLAKKEFILQ